VPLKLFFLATDSVIGPNNQDLWVTDGTTAAPVGGLGNLGVSGSATGGLGAQNITAFGQQMIFAGADALNSGGSNGLWLTDGTAGGTTEIGGVSPGLGGSPPFNTGSVNGLAPNGFVTFASGTKAIFFGADAQNFDGMWATDGTAGGTLELGGLENLGIAGKGANFSPDNLAAFNNIVFFDAIDSTGFKGLWTTDGTTAGTVELGGVTQNQGVFDSGTSNFFANDFITLGGLALFNAPNAAGHDALWISDGTGNGTVELGGVDNAGIAGAINVNFGDGLENAVRFGARIFFSGSDIGGGAGLWTTDGTAGGTVEVGGLADAGVTGHPSSLGLNPTDLTVNGQQVLFNGRDALSFQELWASDGTANGTYEIGGEGVGGTLPHEAINGIDPTSIVSLGNGQAVFIGRDDSNGQPSGRPTLWVTDGTFAGTQEIGGLDNLGVSGIDQNGGFSFTNTLMGGDGLAYFVGADVAGNQVLWETDGTVGGTKVITSPQAASTGIHPSNLAVAEPPAAATDIAGGGKTITLEDIPGQEVTLSGTNNVPDTVNGSNGLINLNGAQALAIGGGLLITFIGIGVGNAVTLSNTNGNKDSVHGPQGEVTFSGAQAIVSGPQTIKFAAGTSGNAVYVTGTAMPTFENFAAGDTIDLLNVVANGSSYAGGLLTLMKNGVTVDQLTLSTPYAQSAFQLSADGQGGTQIELVSPAPQVNGTTASYDNAIGGVYVDLAAGFGERAGALLGWGGGPTSQTPVVTDPLIGIQSVTGSPFDDLLVGGLKSGTLSGGGGNDLIYGNTSQATANNAAQMTLDGGIGTNALYGSSAFNTFIGGDANGGINQMWGAASKMPGVSGFTNNTLSFAGLAAGHSAYVDLLNGHDAYVNSGPNNNGAYTPEDDISNIPNVIGSSGGDIIQGDNGTDGIAGGAGADHLYAGGGPDTFVYTGYGDSNLVNGYDTIVGFKIGPDKLDVSALNLSASNIVIDTVGTQNAVYIEQTPNVFNAATDLAIMVTATTPAGLHASDFNF
jgi:ELWxxDGT repeat protein